MDMIVNYFNNYDEKTLAECKELYAKYEPILINKPQYTTEEANLWFEFMGACHKNYLFPYYALQKVCETLMEIHNQNDKRVKLGGTPDNGLMFPPIRQYDGKENHLAHAFVNSYNTLEWQLQAIGIDTSGWYLLVKDTESDRIFRSGIAWSSPAYLVSIFATLRAIPTDQIETEYIY